MPKQLLIPPDEDRNMGASHRTKPSWLRSAERQGLVSAMNATKWRKVAAAMHALAGGPPIWVAKDIDRDGPSGRDHDWVYHLRPYETLEWVDILCGGSRMDEVLAALSSVGVRGVARQSVVRVYGWLRPAAPSSGKEKGSMDEDGKA